MAKTITIYPADMSPLPCIYQYAVSYRQEGEEYWTKVDPNPFQTPIQIIVPVDGVTYQIMIIAMCCNGIVSPAQTFSIPAIDGEYPIEEDEGGGDETPIGPIG